jgi:membrane-anchored mycosin MYCP
MIPHTDDEIDEIDYDRDQIVVATPHVPRVEHMLANTMNVTTSVIGSDDRLGLAILALDGHAGITGRMRPNLPPSIRRFSPAAAAQLEKGRDALLPFSDLDSLLLSLRAEFADKYDGWIPLLGKNRDVDIIVGYPYPRSITVLLAYEPVVDIGERRPLKVGYQGGPPVPSKVVSAADAGRNVRVGVLDTSLYPHPSLAGHYIAPDDALHQPAPGETVAPAAGHATLVADLIRRQAPAAQLVVQAALSSDLGTAKLWDVARKMMSFADAGIDVLNLSFGCRTRDGQPPLVLQRAIELLTPDIVIVAAAGNHGNVAPAGPGKRPNSPTWPAAHHDVVAVGAHRPADPFKVADFSPKAPWVRFTAIGEDVDGAFIDAKVKLSDGEEPEESHGRARWSGTSFAAATVAGVIAANTRSGQRCAREALAALSDDPGSVVKKYSYVEAPDA